MNTVSLKPAAPVQASGQSPAENRGPAKKVLLVSNRVMHYRVSVYNYFWRRFKENGWEFSVFADRLQRQNQNPLCFDFKEMPFRFGDYKREIQKLKPDAVILFLHLKDQIFWPLVHWLKLSGIPVIFWTKTRNLDDANNRLKNILFNYMMRLCDGLILYTEPLITNVPANTRHKAFAANNTVNFEDYPAIAESKEDIKRELGIIFKKIVLFAGRISEEGNRKKVDHLIEMFNELPGDDLGLVIVGSGMPDHLKERLNPKNSIFLGEVHDAENRQISRIFKMSDICSIPGHVGLGLNQAFYWGLPMVTEAGLQPPEIFYLQNGRNGFIVPEDDVAALKEKILFLAGNEAVLEQFSQNARADILQHGSIEGMFQGFQNCVNHVTNSKPARNI